MPSFEIDNDPLKISILEFIFLQNEENNIKSLNDKKTKYLVHKVRNRNPKSNSDFVITLGYGSHKFIYKNEVFLIKYFEEDHPKGTDCDVKYFTRLTIETPNVKIFEKFLNKIRTEKNTENTLQIFITNEYGEWYAYNKIPSRKLDSIYISDDIKTNIVNDIDFFFKSEDEYNKFGIPYKKTFLITGIAGSGKTSLIKSLCNHFKYNLCMLSISKKFDNSCLISAIRFIEDNSFLLIEDIDSLFEKRQATDDNPSITFSNLINILDGVLYKHGIIIFLTTNHPEKLDHALLRVGRIDSIIKINYPSKKDIEKLFIDIKMDKNDFETFYNHIKSEKIPMSAIVNFLFQYKSDWLKNINILLDTNSYIRKTLNQDKDNSLYS
jgi:chaperone BCS1